MQLGDYSCGHHVVGIAPQYKSRSSYDILKGIMSEYVILFIYFYTIFSQGCSVHRGWFEWGADEKEKTAHETNKDKKWCY